MKDLPASHPLYGSEQSKSGFGICYQFAIKCPVSVSKTQYFQGFAGFVSYSHSIKKYIGSYAAAMGGLDAIVFGGGIGLGSALVRALSLEGLEFLGVKLDGFKNRMAIAGMDISMEDAPVRVFTVHTDEEIIVARKAAALLQKQA